MNAVLTEPDRFRMYYGDWYERVGRY